MTPPFPSESRRGRPPVASSRRSYAYSLPWWSLAWCLSRSSETIRRPAEAEGRPAARGEPRFRQRELRGDDLLGQLAAELARLVVVEAGELAPGLPREDGALVLDAQG